MKSSITNTHGQVQSLQPSFSEAVDLSTTDAVFTQPRTLFIGVAGDITVDLFNSPSGATGTLYKAASAGDFPRQVRKVYKVGTAATNIVSEY